MNPLRKLPVPGRFFLDTNVVVCCFDSGMPHKQQRAKELLAHGASSGFGIVSYQVLQEFCSVSTASRRLSLDTDSCMAYVTQLLQPMNKVAPSTALLEQALMIRQQTQYAFYESLTIAAAVQAGCATLYSEDLQHNQLVEGVRIVNPFLQTAQQGGAAAHS